MTAAREVYHWHHGMPRGTGPLVDGVLDARPTDLATSLAALVTAYRAELTGHARRTSLATVVTHLEALLERDTTDRSRT